MIDGTEPAVPGTYVAHEHERRRPMSPALTDIGTLRLLAHRVELERRDNGPGLRIARTGGHTDFNPVRVATLYGTVARRSVGGGLRTDACTLVFHTIS